MAIYAISDIHVKLDGRNSEILKSFLSLPYKTDDVVYLLGDIFDLLIGPHEEYQSIFPWFFSRLDELISQGIEVHYFEGNHDFHLENLLEKRGVKLHKNPIVKEYFGKKILFCHGDEIEIGNKSYKIYKNFITSKPLNFIANNLMPFSVLNFIGDNASKKSRKRNQNRYGDPQANILIRDRFRETAELAQKKYQVDMVVCGHSHFRDHYTWNGYDYFNCGYLPVTKNYLKIDETIEFINL